MEGYLMWWLILWCAVGILGYFIFSQNAEKHKLINRTVIKDNTIPLSLFLENLEKLKGEDEGDKEYITFIDREITELKIKYGTNIPAGRVPKLVKDYQEKIKQIKTKKLILINPAGKEDKAVPLASME